MPPHGVHPVQAAKELKAAGASPKVTSPVHKFLQGEAQKQGIAGGPATPAMRRRDNQSAGTFLGNVGHAAAHAGETVYQASPFPGAINAFQNPGNKAAQQRITKQQGKALSSVGEAATGYKEIRHIAQHPLAGSLALAGLLPFGRVGKIAEEISVAADAGKAARAAKVEGKAAGFMAERRAIKASRRIAPITNAAERHAHLVDLSNKAMEEAPVRDAVARYRHEATVKLLEQGHVSPETGGEFGRIIRHGLSPNFKGMGKYEKIGAKLDNPGVAELRKQQDELRHAALSKKAAELRSSQKSAKTWDELLKAGAARRGALPAGDFKGFAGLEHHMEDLRQYVQNLDMLPLDRARLVDSIDAAMHGHVPAPAEQRLMERAFGRERSTVAQAVMAGGKKNALLQIASIPRAIKSSGDLSWGFRQGLTAAAYNPKLFGKTFAGMFKPALSEAEAQARMAQIVHDPYFPLLVKMGVPFTDLGTAERGALNLADKEEAIMSNYAEHLHEMPIIRSTPGVKQGAKVVSKVVRASDRGYVVPLNEIRLGLGSQMLHQALENGWNVEGKLGKDIGGLVGVLTGRGDLPKFLQKHRATINSLFFSPGLMSSRIHMLSPTYHLRLEPFARQQSLKAARNLTGTLLAVLFAAKMAGAKVQTNPRSADFGKIRIGNTRIDVAGGYSQYLTLAGRLATQETISSTTGKKTKLSGKSFGTSDWDLIQNFFENKMSPVASEAVTIAKRNRFGQPLTPTGELGQMFSPLLWNDMYQLAKAQGPGGGPGVAAATFLPDLFGVGVNNYAPSKKKQQGNPFGGGTGGGLPDSGSVGGGLPG